MNPSRLLVLGSGGREHALAWRLARDLHHPQVVVAPGNDGMAARFECLAVPDGDDAALVSACRGRGIELVVVGAEGPLAAGIADRLTEAGVLVFGPSAAAARLESSKWFAKEVMGAAGVPTARASAFESATAARAAIGAAPGPWVLKADGLAAGKGVLVTAERGAAEAFASECLLGGRFGASGRRVVLEEFLPGEEASVMAICDGTNHVLLPAARDYKRAFDGDAGPNTGGMGAYAPAPSVTPEVEQELSDRVVTPVLREMAARGTPFRGTLYCGIMVERQRLKVVEFNVRFGDPETQSILPLVSGSLSGLLASAARGKLDKGAVGRSGGAAVTLALVDEGYPEVVRGGGRLEGLEAAESDDTMVFHAATRRAAGGWDIHGGRAAYVTAIGSDVAAARASAYAARSRIGGGGWRSRSDIAERVRTADSATGA